MQLSVRAFRVGLVSVLLGSACSKAPTNLVLITVDTLRADRLGAYGYSENTSPNIDALAARGVLFSSASTPIPRTTQSVATLFTGRYPFQHGVVEIGERLRDEERTLAEILREAGYRTIGISANRAAGRLQGLEQGFDVFVGRSELWRRQPVQAKAYGRPSTAEMGPAEAVTREALKQLEAHATGPYFLWLLYFDPHWAYNPPAPYNEVIDWKQFSFYRDLLSWEPKNANVFFNLNGRSEQARAQASRLYDAEVRYTDAMIGHLLEALRSRSDADQTLIVLSADHGESLGEHGYYYEHGDFVYQTTMHVPLVFHQPGTLPEGRVVEGPVSNVDVAPTVLSLLDIKAKGQSGRDLTAALRDPQLASDERVVLGESGSALLPQNQLRHIGGRRSTGRVRGEQIFRYARRGEWAVVVRGNQTELYQAHEDPTYQNDLAARFPDAAAALRKELEAVLPGAGRWRMARDGRFKLIRIPELGQVRFALYDLEADPQETRDQAAERPDVVERLRKPLEAYLRASLKSSALAAARSPEEQLRVEEQLRALGYLE